MSIKILSKDNDLIGTDKYRDDAKVLPMAYRPTIDNSVTQNAKGTNNSVTIKSVTPVVVTANGVTSSADSFLMVTKFSSLQHITNDAEREQCYDDHVRMLILNRSANLYGQLPDVPVVFPSTGIPKIA